MNYRKFVQTALLYLATLLAFSCSQTKRSQTDSLSTRDIAKLAFEKGRDSIDLGLYPGSLLMHALSEYVLLEGNEPEQAAAIALFKQFDSKEIEGRGNFIAYEAGGSGAAYLAWRGITRELDDQILEAAQRMFSDQVRSPEGLITSKSVTQNPDRVFIDVAFAVTPFLLYSGLHYDNQEYVDFAVFETLELFRILKDESTGLVHQARGFNGFNNLTEDNWSRGNGWGSFALSILVRDLPEDHPRRGEVVALAKRFYTAVLEHQNDEGLWHQEMTAPESYVETSGSGMLLFGLGIMLEKGLLDEKYRNNFIQGLRAYTSYIGTDGSVSHTCRGCLCPGNGTKEDYMNREWIFNDPHAFGPVVLAFTQADKLGIKTIEPLKGLGYYISE